jgi:hypothetical protein
LRFAILLHNLTDLTLLTLGLARIPSSPTQSRRVSFNSRSFPISGRIRADPFLILILHPDPHPCSFQWVRHGPLQACSCLSIETRQTRRIFSLFSPFVFEPLSVFHFRLTLVVNEFVFLPVTPPQAYGARFATSLISCTHLLIDTSSPRYSSLLTSKPSDEQTERILAWLGRTGKILSYQWARGVCAVGLEEANREVLPLTLGWAAPPPPPPPAPVEVIPVVNKTVGKVMLKRPVETMEADEEVVDREEK